MDPCAQVSPCLLQCGETCVRQVSWVGWNMLPSPYVFNQTNSWMYFLWKAWEAKCFQHQHVEQRDSSRRLRVMVSCGFWWSDASDHGVSICDFWRLLDKSFETSVFCRSGCYRPSFTNASFRLFVWRWFALICWGLWLGLCACELGGAVRPALHLLGLYYPNSQQWATFGSDWISLDLCCISAMNFSVLPGEAELELARLCQLQTRASKVQRKMRCVRSRCSLFSFLLNFNSWSRMTAQRRFKLEMNWNQEELEQWAIAARQKEEDSFSLGWWNQVIIAKGSFFFYLHPAHPWKKPCHKTRTGRISPSFHQTCRGWAYLGEVQESWWLQGTILLDFLLHLVICWAFKAAIIRAILDRNDSGTVSDSHPLVAPQRCNDEFFFFAFAFGSICFKHLPASQYNSKTGASLSVWQTKRQIAISASLNF